MKFEYLINIASMMHIGYQKKEKFPRCFFKSPEILIEEAISLGYDGIQALPIRGLMGSENGILLYEDAWNAVPGLWHALRHRSGSENMPSKIQDWVVSPNPDTCKIISKKLENRGIPKIVHSIGENPHHILEIHPGLPQPEQLESLFLSGQKICVDTLHFAKYCEKYISPGWDSTSLQYHLLSKWREKIKVIHIHESDSDLEDIINLPYPARDSSTGIIACNAIKLARIAKAETKLYLVAEYAQGIRKILRPSSVRALAKQKLEAMQRIVEGSLRPE